MVKKKSVVSKKAGLNESKCDCLCDSWYGRLFVKLSIIMFTVILLKIFPVLIDFITTTDIWWFILALVIFAIVPVKRYYKR